MEISNLPLSPSHRGKLLAAGYTTLASLASISPVQLAQELNIVLQEAYDILRVTAERRNFEWCNEGPLEGASLLSHSGAKTAWDILSEERSLRHITTGSQKFDAILGGGIHCSGVTEIGGVPGIGKTQLGYTEHIAVINYLEKFLEEQKNVKIIIIDSITFHFRQDFDDLALRTRVLSGISLKLMKLAKKLCLAVLLFNQVTTKFTEGSFQLTLALGDSWSHACTNRIILYWNGDERCAYIDKSPSLPSASAPFSVTREGIRDALRQHKRARTT